MKAGGQEAKKKETQWRMRKNAQVTLEMKTASGCEKHRKTSRHWGRRRAVI